jgi:hypothetical protein
MKIPARLVVIFASLSILLPLAVLNSRSSSAQAPTEYVFYGEDREELRLGQTVLTDVDGYLNKSSYQAGTCAEKYNNAMTTTADVHDEEDVFLAGGRCTVDMFWMRRFYLNFDTSSLPDDAAINSATLYLTKAEIDAVEHTARFEILSSSWSDAEKLQASDWDSGATVLGTFDPPADDPQGTAYSITLDPGGVSKTGLTQFEIRLYDEVGETNFYGSDRETILQNGRQRIFYSGDGAPQGVQPRLVVTTTAGPSNGQPKLYEGWNKVFWSGSASPLSADQVLVDIDAQCGSGTALAISRRRQGFLESFRTGYGGVNFLLSSGENYYILASRECVWDKL